MSEPKTKASDPITAALEAPPPPPPDERVLLRGTGPGAGAATGPGKSFPITAHKPQEVRPISGGPATQPAQPARAHNPLIDGPTPVVNNARNQANALRQVLQALFRTGEDALKQIDSLCTTAKGWPDAAKLFEAEGLDVEKLCTLAADIEGVLNRYKPKSSPAAA